jgi:hypothetical protein
MSAKALCSNDCIHLLIKNPLPSSECFVVFRDRYPVMGLHATKCCEREHWVPPHIAENFLPMAAYVINLKIPIY